MTGEAVRLRVFDPGALTTVQDRGRTGLAHLGVSRSGAADRGAHDLANRLVGNGPRAATLESLLGGLVVEATQGVWVAATGAPVDVRVNGARVGSHVAVFVPSGGRLAVGRPATGLRTYVAVRGGIAVPKVLGSRARDTLGRLGPEPLAAGDLVPMGRPGRRPLPGSDLVPVPAAGDGPLVVTIDPGPRTDWLSPEALAVLTGADYEVATDSDRVGVRLRGPALHRTRTDELPSEGVLPGAVQVPPNGIPLVFLADAPTVGGYPIVAVVREADLDRLAQARPGSRVRFRWGVRPDS